MTETASGAPVALGPSLLLSSYALASPSEAGDFAVYTNVRGQGGVDFNTLSSSATHAFIIFHDASRSAQDNANDLVVALQKSPTDPSLQRSIVFAPWFIEDPNDWPSSMRPMAPLSWPTDSYIEGGDATGGSSPSSYRVVDELLRLLADPQRFAQLQFVTLVGHSAGGQTAQLYTMALGANTRLGSSQPMPFNLMTLIANPSSYAYLDDERPLGSGFATAQAAGCAGVNQWKFGLTQIPADVAVGEPNVLATSYARRPIGYALGLDDNNPTDPTMDQGCEAEAQGPTRLSRGRSFYSHLRALFPTSSQTLCEVPGVGHDTAAMLQSACAANVLFRSAPSPDKRAPP